MGACATKPKVDGGKALAPEPAPAPEKKVEEKDVVVDTVVAVEAEKKVEVPAEKVAGEGNQSDKGKEVVVDEYKVDDQSLKRRSLSHLFKEKEGGESNEYEGPAGETETLESKETEKDRKEAKTRASQTEVETEKCMEEPETKVPQTVVEAEKCIEESETKLPQTVVETEKHIEEAEIKAPQTVVEIEKHTEEAEPKAPQTEEETEKLSEVSIEKITITDVPTTSETIPEEKVTVPSPSNVARTSETPKEKTSEDVKLPAKVEKPEAVTLVEATPAKDESKTSDQKKEDISDVGKTETETQKETEPKPATPTETSTEPAQKNDVVKVTAEEKMTS